MSLRASIEKLQIIGSRLYSELGHRFSENNTLVREAWLAMSCDMEQQTEALQALTTAYWRQLKPQENTLTSAAAHDAFEMPKSIDNISLMDAITLSLHLEETIILRFYVPLARLLRANETNSELDFYILVKAHVARLQRIVNSFSGDPILTRRCLALMETFEREVQTPIHAFALRATNRTIPIRSERPRATRKAHSGTRARQSRTLGEHTRRVPKRAKPLVKKIGMRRSGAHR